MSTYNFEKTVTKSLAFQNYLEMQLPENFPEIISQNISEGIVVITTATELTEDQLVVLSATVDAYVDPEYWLQLNRTESMTGVSQATVGTALTDVQSLIFASNIDTIDGTVVDAIKSILKITTTDISEFTELTTGSVNCEIYDDTRQVSICTASFDISSVISAWHTRALASESGPATAYKSMMISGLKDKTCTYDCIYVIRLSSPDSKILVRMNGFQLLKYDVL